MHLSSQPKFWEGLLTALGRQELAEDARFKTREARIRNFSELTRVLAEAVANKPRAEWMTLLEANDVPFAPVHNIADVIDDPQVRHLKTFRTLKHPTEGDIVAIRRPVHRSTASANEAHDLPPPTLGEHNEAVLDELGYDAAGIARLKNAKVI